MNKASHWSDGLFCQISSSLARRVVSLLSDTVNLLVEFSTVKVSVLTSTWDSGGHTGRMPGSDTGNLTETTMCLSGKSRDTPTSDDTLKTVTTSYTEDINQFVLTEDRIHRYLLFEQRLCEGDFGTGVSSSVDLDLHNVSLFNTKVELLDLSVSNYTHNTAEFGNTLKVCLDFFATVFLIFEGILCVGLLL